jgi:hypothetical protein
MADTLCLLKGTVDDVLYSAYFIYRDDYGHSGNWRNLKVALERGMLEGHKFDLGYYGDRLVGFIRLAPIDVLMRWKHGC